MRPALLHGLVLALALALAAPAVASAQSPPEGMRVLFVPGGSVPARVRRTVSRLLAASGVLVSYEDYARAANRRNLRPTSRRAIRAVGTRQNATVIVLASYGGHYRRRVLRLRYYSGRTGELLTSSNHGLRGQHLRPASQHGIINDLTAAASGTPSGSSPPVDDEGDDEGDEGDEGSGDEGDEGDASEPGEDEGGLPPPLDWGAEEAPAEGDEPPPPAAAPEEEEAEGAVVPIAEQRQWGFGLAVGAGISHRSSSIPTSVGEPVRLSTTPFFGIQARLLGYVRPDVTSLFRLGLAVRYTTSVGLRAAQDLPDDREPTTTDLRAHHLTLGLRGDIPLADGLRPPYLRTELGVGFRMLDAETPLSTYFPQNYTLAGLYLRVGVFFNIGDGPLSIGLVPEIGSASSLSSQLNGQAQVEHGFLVGAEAHVVLEIIPELVVTLLYREAHAFLGSALGSEMNDAERYAILRAEYRF